MGRLPGRVLGGFELADVTEVWPAREVRRMAGPVGTFVTDEVVTPSGAIMRRDWLRHPGAVGIIALDDFDRVAVVTQYRHPAGHVMVECPAGLLDLDGESALQAAQRELAEEAELQARDWRVLVDLFTSPGSSQECIRMYLARDLAPAPRPDGFELEDEEAEMGVGWVDLDDAVAGIYAGRLQSPTLLAGLLSLWAARRAGTLEQLRPGDAPWPARAAKLARDVADGDGPRLSSIPRAVVVGETPDDRTTTAR
jgi:ADP-ribose pyrophosphatase